jgi:nucleoside-diphosphate-sugar epimerase
MPSVVVTGGAGYLGSVITSRLLFGGWSVTVFDRLAGSGESLLGFASHPEFRLVAADVRDEDLLRTACAGASAVVHLAAVVGEAACAADEANARSINEGGTRAVLSAAEAAGIRRLVMISTCSNYGVSSPDVLADEDAPLRPLGIYAASKVRAEQMVLAHAGPLLTCGLRLGTICGLSPKMRFDLLINEMARAAVLGDAIAIFAPDAWRPFLHIRDAARAVEWALQAPDDVVARQVFNVVGENYQKKQLIDLVRARYPDASISITHAVPDARDYRVAGDRIRERGGFSPEHTIDAAFAEVAEAVCAGVFHDPRWAGHSAAPAVSR